MAYSNGPFIADRWYHCYNRGIDKRTTFVDQLDYRRFLEILYLANDEFPLRRNDLDPRTHEEILTFPRGKRIVTLGAFCLMPGSFDVVLKESAEGGITSFMRKVGTAYARYFNERHGRSGNLFLKPFRSSQVPESHGVEKLLSYVHSLPAVLYEPEWLKNHVVDPQFLEEHLTAYPYSSLGAYAGAKTPNRTLIDLELFASTKVAPLRTMLKEARQYLDQMV